LKSRWGSRRSSVTGTRRRYRKTVAKAVVAGSAGALRVAGACSVEVSAPGNDTRVASPALCTTRTLTRINKGIALSAER
jgi:hypothetical protein